jgi:hypothetical protein
MTDITVPIGAAEAIEIITLAEDECLPPHTLKTRMLHFIDVFQGNTRSYSTWQRKYIRKYFSDAIWLSKNVLSDTILNQIECDRKLNTTKNKG